MEQPKRLYRSSSSRIIAGVCGGLGEYFSIDPTLIRIAFVVLLFGGGFGLAAYIIMWLIVPEQGQEALPIDQRAQAAGQEIQSAAQKAADSVRGANRNNGRVLAGVILIVLGVMALGNMFWPWGWFDWKFFWPLIVVAIGVSIILKRK